MAPSRAKMGSGCELEVIFGLLEVIFGLLRRKKANVEAGSAEFAPSSGETTILKAKRTTRR